MDERRELLPFVSGTALELMYNNLDKSAFYNLLGVVPLKDRYGIPMDYNNTMDQIVRALIKQLQARDLLIQSKGYTDQGTAYTLDDLIGETKR